VVNKIRKPADFDFDRHRSVIGALLFGSYSDSINYGALSLTQEGLPSYGTVSCRLKSIAVERRTSFLESNSFKFVDEHGINPGKELPDGYTACWENRNLLVLAKLGRHLAAGQGEDEFQKILIHSDAKNRENDEFVEAHIFESFDRNAIESLVQSPNCKLNRDERMDFELAESQFTKLARDVK